MDGVSLLPETQQDKQDKHQLVCIAIHFLVKTVTMSDIMQYIYICVMCIQFRHAETHLDQDLIMWSIWPIYWSK